MKVLLDENLDHALRRLLGPHEIVTAAYAGWAGLKNGELLRAAEENGIDVLLTGDKTLKYEQNLAGRRLAIVALSAIQLPIIVKSLPETSPQSTGRFPAHSRRWTAVHSVERNQTHNEASKAVWRSKRSLPASVA